MQTREEKLLELLRDIKAACDRHPLMVGFVHNPTRQELQDRLDAIKALCEEAEVP